MELRVFRHCVRSRTWRRSGSRDARSPVRPAGWCSRPRRAPACSRPHRAGARRRPARSRRERRVGQALFPQPPASPAGRAALSRVLAGRPHGVAPSRPPGAGARRCGALSERPGDDPSGEQRPRRAPPERRALERHDGTGAATRTAEGRPRADEHSARLRRRWASQAVRDRGGKARGPASTRTTPSWASTASCRRRTARTSSCHRGRIAPFRSLSSRSGGAKLSWAACGATSSNGWHQLRCGGRRTARRKSIAARPTTTSARTGCTAPTQRFSLASET